ncbi:hypothetical protein LINPERPRIM_LOCUS4437 [Linum perenne]
MLFAVEGGGFFSSSASGYSKGLTLLLLGQKQEEKPMRVAPWNHYQLVDHEPDPRLQLASLNSRASRGCASFACFGRASAGVDSPSHLKVGPAQQQDALPDTLVVDATTTTTEIVEDDKNSSKPSLRSSLKKPLNAVPAPVENASQCAALNEQVSDVHVHNGRRKVQWTDACGSELTEIREFEPRYPSSHSLIWFMYASQLNLFPNFEHYYPVDSFHFSQYREVSHSETVTSLYSIICLLLFSSVSYISLWEMTPFLICESQDLHRI